MFLKGLIAAGFESSELVHLLRLNGVSASSLHRESTDSPITIQLKTNTPKVCLRGTYLA